MCTSIILLLGTLQSLTQSFGFNDGLEDASVLIQKETVPRPRKHPKKDDVNNENLDFNSILKRTLPKRASQMALMPSNKASTKQDITNLGGFYEVVAAKAGSEMAANRSVASTENTASVKEGLDSKKQNAALCGCGGCKVEWLPNMELAKALLYNMPCNVIAEVLKVNNPDLNVSSGDRCNSFADRIFNFNLGAHNISQYVTKATCDNGLTVKGLEVLPASTKKTSVAVALHNGAEALRDIGVSADLDFKEPDDEAINAALDDIDATHE